MEILETQVYRGANIWAPLPMIRFLLDIGELEERPTNTIDGFYEKLTTTIPSMYRHRCSVGKPGGFFERVREGTWLGHVVEHTALELQNLAGQEVGRGKARSARDANGERRYGIYHVVFEYEQEDVGITAGHLAKRLLESFIWPERDPEFDYQRELERLIRLAERRETSILQASEVPATFEGRAGQHRQRLGGGRRLHRPRGRPPVHP
jgi:cyanophycin synthetase